MKITWIKQKNDNKNFVIFEKMGMDVVNLNNPEEVDKKMEELISKNYNTIFLSNELAGFSENIIKKYKNNNNINIIIAKRK